MGETDPVIGFGRNEKLYQLSNEILAFYRQTQESKRLTTNTKGQLEFVRTREIITRYLPDPPVVVLDIGGGSGPYSCWLAKAGYEVHLVDPVDLHIEQAKEAANQQPEHPIASISLGDARALRFSPVSHALRLCSTVFLKGNSRILFIETLFKTTLKRVTIAI